MLRREGNEGQRQAGQHFRGEVVQQVLGYVDIDSPESPALGLMHREGGHHEDGGRLDRVEGVLDEEAALALVEEIHLIVGMGVKFAHRHLRH